MLNRLGKKNPAFTFMEVLIAMGILTATVMLTSKEQMRSIFRVMRDRDKIEKIFLLKKDLYNHYFKTPDPKQKKKFTVNLEEPEIKITTEFIDIQKKSSLKDFAKKIYLVKATGEWKQEDENRQADMITLVVRPPEKKDRK